MQPSIATPIPALGATFQLEVGDMPAFAPVIGMIGLEPAAIALTDIDEFLFVDPARFTDLRMIAIADAAGSFVWSFPVPADQRLSGFPVFVQALSIADAGITAVTSGGILRLGN
jgi:hypothetical protein